MHSIELRTHPCQPSCNCPHEQGVWLLARCADLQGLEYDVRRFGLCLLALFGLGLMFRWGRQLEGCCCAVKKAACVASKPTTCNLTHTCCRVMALIAMLTLHRDKQR